MAANRKAHQTHESEGHVDGWSDRKTITLGADHPRLKSPPTKSMTRLLFSNDNRTIWNRRHRTIRSPQEVNPLPISVEHRPHGAVAASREMELDQPAQPTTQC